MFFLKDPNILHMIQPSKYSVFLKHLAPDIKQWYQAESWTRTTSHPVNNPKALPNGDPQLGLLVKHWLSLPYSPMALCSI